MNKNILIIDVGNTNTVFSIFVKGKAVFNWRISTKINRTSDEYKAWLNNMFSSDLNDKIVIDDVIIGSVVPAVLFELKKTFLEKFNIDAKIIGQNIKVNIKTQVDNPREVGSDRLVNALAAWKKYNSSAIVVDFGTATTFDIINSKGTYIGGVIAPGINLSLEALHTAAAKLPRIAIERPRSVIGTNTVSAMQSGVYWGYIGLIEGIINNILLETKEKMKIVATGGLAKMFSLATKVIEDVEMNLTIDGLYQVYLNNKIINRKE